MVSASLTTSLIVIGLSPALLLLLARRSKRSEMSSDSGARIRSFVARAFASSAALPARARPPSFSPIITVTFFLLAWCAAVIIPSRVGFAEGRTLSGRGDGVRRGAAYRGQRRTAFLPGKVVWITGASSGLGEQLAISAAAKGAAALILSGRREDALERVKRACEEASRIEGRGARRDGGAGLRVEVLPFDVEDLEFVEKEAAGRAVQLFGRVDALVLNAGISTRGSVEDTSLDVDMQVMAVNYFGPVGLAKGLLEARGATAAATTTATNGAGPSDEGEAAAGREALRFVVINSVQGKFGMAFRSSYAASKHALAGFFDSLRAEHAHRGVGVLNVFPGYIRTSLSVNALTADGTKYAQMDATTAHGRDPREVADDIWQAAAEAKDEIVLADLKTKVAVLLRALAPRVLFGVMARRALKAGEGKTPQ